VVAVYGADIDRAQHRAKEAAAAPVHVGHVGAGQGWTRSGGPSIKRSQITVSRPEPWDNAQQQG